MTYKNIFIIFLIISFSVNFDGVAQKIKIKKGIISIDKNPVAKHEEQGLNTDIFYFLDGKKAFEVDFKSVTVSPTEAHQWLVMTSAEGEKTEIPYEVLTVSFNSKKILIHLLMEKYKIFTSQKLDADQLSIFFAEERESLSDQYLKAGMAAAEEAAKREEILGQYKPFVKEDGSIIFGGSFGSKIVGYVHYYKSSQQYAIKDLDGIQVAMTEKPQKMAQTTVFAKTYTDETFEFDRGSSTMLKSNFSRNFAQIFVEETVGRNYRLGREAKSHKAKMHQEKIIVAKENSVNLYKIKGYVINEDGEKINGDITAIFEPLDLNPQDGNDVLKSLNVIDKYGKYMSITYLNDRGKTRTKEFKAKDDIEFCVIIADKKHCYSGMQTKGNAMKKLMNASNLGFNNAYFYKRIYKLNEHQLLIKPDEASTYVIKVSDQSKAFMVDDRNNSNLSSALADYLSACSQLAKDIENEEFDLKNEENLKNILEEYQACL